MTVANESTMPAARSIRPGMKLLPAQLSLLLLLNLQYFVLLPSLHQTYNNLGTALPGATESVISVPIWAAIIVTLAIFGLIWISKRWLRILICCVLLIANIYFAMALYAPFIVLSVELSPGLKHIGG